MSSDEIQYYGGTQGMINSLPDEQGSFEIRELASDTLIKCVMPSHLYPQLAELKESQAVVNIGGMVTASRSSRKAQSIVIDKIQIAEAYRHGDVDRFIGCAPGQMSEHQINALIRHHRNRDIA